MRITAKIVLLPTVVVVTAAWLLAVLVSKIYGFTHGFLWVTLLVPIALACCLQMWHNALVFLVLGTASYVVLFGMTAVEVVLETIQAMLIRAVAE